MGDRKQSEAGRKASLVRAYFRAVDKREKACTAQVKASIRLEALTAARDAAAAACAAEGVNVSVPS